MLALHTGVYKPTFITGRINLSLLSNSYVLILLMCWYLFANVYEINLNFHAICIAKNNITFEIISKLLFKAQ
jgi:hypothetical protein